MTTDEPVQGLTDAARSLLTAVDAELDATWGCNSYHPLLLPAVEAMRAALAAAPHTATPVPADIRRALEIGLEAAQEVAATFHRDMAGYRQARHDAVDADVRTIQAAIDSLPAAHIRRVGTLKISADGGTTRAEIDPPHWWLQCMLGEHAVYVAAPASDADSMPAQPTKES